MGWSSAAGESLGFAWTAVALDALSHELDWDPRTADVLVGTSAGAEMVALLGSGRSPADILAAVRGSSTPTPCSLGTWRSTQARCRPAQARLAGDWLAAQSEAST